MTTLDHSSQRLVNVPGDGISAEIVSWNLQCNFLKRFNTQLELSNLKILYLGANSLEEFPDLAVFPKIEELYLNNNFITKISGSSLSRSLKILDLRQNRLVKTEGLSQFPCLVRFGTGILRFVLSLA